MAVLYANRVRGAPERACRKASIGRDDASLPLGVSLPPGFSDRQPSRIPSGLPLAAKPVRYRRGATSARRRAPFVLSITQEAR